jgi:hypothetical protein
MFLISILVRLVHALGFFVPPRRIQESLQITSTREGHEQAAYCPLARELSSAFVFSVMWPSFLAGQPRVLSSLYFVSGANASRSQII